jgi:peptidoglycan/LPS O-acetylase OafA/YrhL
MEFPPKPCALFLGRISYSVYLWGFVAIAFIQRFGHDRFHLPVLAVDIALGTASYFLIERPIQSFGRKLIEKPRLAVSSFPAY